MKTTLNFIFLTFAVVVARPAVSADDAAKPAAAVRPALADPSILLVRDEAVRQELALADEQRQAVDALLERHNRVLLAIRDVGPTGADETAQPAMAEIRGELRKLLTQKQRMRLQGLILQAQGYESLMRTDVAKQLALSPSQQENLADINDDFWTESKKLQAPGESRSADDLQQALMKLQADRQRRVLAELNEKQTKLWARVLGEQFDFSRVRSSPARAPEFEGADFASADAWLNSPPLTMESLRGRVVVVHFFAFGCSNCINNYPWYREWHDAFQGQEVTIVGIHTPETEGEKDREQLRLSMEKHDLKFPVAIDKDKKMWQAWYNGMWPSVYLVDRQGRVRYWWYGELDWKGAGGQKVARERIEQLLAEDLSPPPSKGGAGGGISVSQTANPAP